MVDHRALARRRRPTGAAPRIATAALGLGCILVAVALGFQQRDESRLRDAGRQGLAGNYLGAITGAGQVQRAPALGQALLLRAHAEAEIGRYAAAVPDFRAALRRDPQNWNIHADLGAALLAQGDVGAATGELHAALALNPLQ